MRLAATAEPAIWTKVCRYPSLDFDFRKRLHRYICCLVQMCRFFDAPMDKRGFTLLELMVVVAIIGILSATAIAAFSTYSARASEAVVVSYMRSWVPAQELYLQKNGHYADAVDQLLQGGLGVLYAAKSNIPYDFSIDSASLGTTTWGGRATPRTTGFRYFYIDQTGIILSSLTGPPHP